MKKDIIKSIRIAWDSLDSHLADTQNKRLKGGIIGNRSFHKRCCEDYAFIISTLTKLL